MWKDEVLCCLSAVDIYGRVRSGGPTTVDGNQGLEIL